MKVYLAIFSGLEHSGDCIVVAPHEADAKILLMQKLEEQELMEDNEHLDFDTLLQEVDTSKAGVSYFYNGDG